jgi:glycosyltransferase involved in cell wall biosynthesis
MSAILMTLNRVKAQVRGLVDLVATRFRASSSPRVTVVINTYNRAKSLERTLEGLRNQTYPKFEVIVVNGPSTDNTDVLLERTARDIKVAACPEANIGLSRNIGVDIAAGKIIAFVDDDAVPSNDWLEKLVTAYRVPLVMAAGGYVKHDDGLLWGPCACSRFGDPLIAADPPASRYLGKKANPFLYLAGCNMSFRRTALMEAGGFNENLTYPMRM